MTGWDNVDYASDYKLYVGGMPNGSATVFLNGKHQTPVHLGISFEYLKRPGPAPSPQDVLGAIHWIDNETGKPVEAVVATSRNDYCMFYGGESRALPAEGRTGEYQYEFDFCFAQADKALVGQTLSLSLRLEARTSDGKSLVIDLSSSGDAVTATYVLFNFVAPKKYGDGTDMSMTPVRAKVLSHVETQLVSHYPYYDDVGELHGMSIDDSLFYIKDYSAPSFGYERICFLTAEKESPSYHRFFNTYLVSNDYSFKTDAPHEIANDLRTFAERITEQGEVVNSFGSLTSSFTAPLSTILFLTFGATMNWHPENNQHYEPHFNIDLHDQFGNPVSVYVRCAPQPEILSIN